MSILAVVALAAQTLFGSSSACDYTDTITGLSLCEMRDIEASAARTYDSLVAAINAGKSKRYSETELQYASVCRECFSRHLSCGKREPADIKYTCIDTSSFGDDE